tara:strand:- start:1499 stop:1765 length:267 start_codon:yes stop_codon:yes gene_type:complete
MLKRRGIFLKARRALQAEEDTIPIEPSPGMIPFSTEWTLLHFYLRFLLTNLTRYVNLTHNLFSFSFPLDVIAEGIVLVLVLDMSKDVG